MHCVCCFPSVSYTHLDVYKRQIQYIAELKKSGDSIGGVVSCVIKGLEIGIGEPIFDKLQALSLIHI